MPGLKQRIAKLEKEHLPPEPDLIEAFLDTLTEPELVQLIALLRKLEANN